MIYSLLSSEHRWLSHDVLNLVGALTKMRCDECFDLIDVGIHIFKTLWL